MTNTNANTNTSTNKNVFYLPGCKAGGAKEVATRFDANVFAVLSTDFAQLKAFTFFSLVSVDL